MVGMNTVDLTTIDSCDRCAIYSIRTFRDAQAFVDRVFNNQEDHDIVEIYSELFKGVQKDIVDDNNEYR
jgi:23S rRNA U2552 (ribose-2'-O)-methylase RlmE/FtsJ